MKKEKAKHPVQLIIKRGMDITVSLLLLPFFMLFAPIIGLCIKLDSKGPIFYRDERTGRWGKPFKCWKFRTMVVNADAYTLALSAQDDRITRFGQFLRKTSLDEFPQILHILRGQMSLVGPRPPILCLAEKYTPHQAIRLQMRPGLTGWAQVSGRNILPYEERLEYDVWYVQNWRLLMDFKILIKTPVVVLSQKGVYQQIDGLTAEKENSQTTATAENDYRYSKDLETV